MMSNCHFALLFAIQRKKNVESNTNVINCVDTIKNQRNMAVQHGDCCDSMLDITERDRVTSTLFEVADLCGTALGILSLDQ